MDRLRREGPSPPQTGARAGKPAGHGGQDLYADHLARTGGETAAMGIARGAQALTMPSCGEFVKAVWGICDHLAATRPTAVNLFWAIERMKTTLSGLRGQPVSEIKHRLVEESQRILDEDIAMNKEIGRHGATLIRDGQNILTHCNAGALATAGYGTALRVVRAAWDQGKKIRV